MNWIRNLKLTPKLMLAFGVVLALMLAQGIGAWLGLASLNGATSELAGATIDSVKTAGDLRALVSEYRGTAYRTLVRVSGAVRAEAREKATSIAVQVESIVDSYRPLIADQAERELFDAFVADWQAALVSYKEVEEMLDLELQEDALDQFVGTTSDLHDQAVDSLAALIAYSDRQAKAAGENAASTYAESVSLVMVMVLLGVAGGFVIASLFARGLSRGMQGAVRVANEVAAGRLDSRIEIDRQDEIGELLTAMQRMQHDLRERIEADRRVAGENLRIRTALDNSGTSVMITDPERRILYANRAVADLLTGYGPEVLKTLPDFDVEQLVGSSIDAFQPESKRLDERLAQVEGTQHDQIQLGDAWFAQAISPVQDGDGQHLGYVVEWRDRTQEMQVEQEIARVVQAAAAGDMSHRIGLDGKQGFIRQLAEQLNGLLDANAASLDEVSRLLGALAEGDLTRRMDGAYQGVFARMRDDANATVDQLADIIAHIKQASVAINSAASEIAAGNSDLSRRTEQQAANLEETAASMEELTSTVRQNADHARQANQLAIGAADVASKGGQVVGQVVSTMRGIETSSKKIAEIISVIDGIAFQTNILALNAAVEAARAGEQGRGFAVVASEVRSLAQRSAGAAKEIKGLIEDSVGKVADGSTLVAQAGQTMDEIVASVQRVTDIMAEITAASQEQSAGIEQVNQTVVQMDEATQQNAALVEEASAAARALEEQSTGLAEAVAAFRLAEGQVDIAPEVRAEVRAVVAKATKPRRQAKSATREAALAGSDWQEF